MLLELLGIAHANNDFHTNEKDLIAKYATALHFSPEKLNLLEAWVVKQLALSAEIQTLLNN